ncbi:hypothetical protein WH47_08836 [Habropoda laboriosa]|uniref:Uncharacterized protein n=1 Tax=Habropoda laboriosa TaxID=597456 RepID=A0A0L7R6G8_9HYME|nr:hypothetical protein WH47_08836 [Habropoda laboriosa]
MDETVCFHASSRDKRSSTGGKLVGSLSNPINNLVRGKRLLRSSSLYDARRVLARDASWQGAGVSSRQTAVQLQFQCAAVPINAKSCSNCAGGSC